MQIRQYAPCVYDLACLSPIRLASQVLFRSPAQESKAICLDRSLEVASCSVHGRGFHVFSFARQTLIDAVDTGSSGWTLKLAMFYYWGIRGSEIPDPTHRRIRSWTNSLSECGLSIATNEFEIVMAYMHGPFKSQAFYTEFQAASKERVPRPAKLECDL